MSLFQVDDITVLSYDRNTDNWDIDIELVGRDEFSTAELIEILNYRFEEIKEGINKVQEIAKVSQAVADK